MSGVFALIKITNKEEHAIQLQQGIIHANRVSWFRKKEYDELDGVGQMKKMNETIFRIDGKDMTPYLPDPITIYTDEISNLNVFCMTAVQPGPFHDEIITDDNYIDYINYLKIDERCRKEFGEHALVFMGDGITEFLKRVRRAADSKGYEVLMNLVEYFDPQVQLEINPFSIAPVFYKRDQFKYQKEFRIAINTKTVGNDPLRLEIGNLEDISFRMGTYEINSKMSISFK